MALNLNPEVPIGTPTIMLLEKLVILLSQLRLLRFRETSIVKIIIIPTIPNIEINLTYCEH